MSQLLSTLVTTVESKKNPKFILLSPKTCYFYHKHGKDQNEKNNTILNEITINVLNKKYN